MQVPMTITTIQQDVRPLLVIKQSLLSVPNLVKNVTVLQGSCSSCTVVRTTITDVQPLLKIKDTLLQVRSQAGS